MCCSHSRRIVPENPWSNQRDPHVALISPSLSSTSIAYEEAGPSTDENTDNLRVPRTASLEAGPSTDETAKNLRVPRTASLEAGTGQAIVFLHAGIADQRMWQHQLEHFRSKSRVLAFDRRGFGGSQPTDEEYSDTNDLGQLLDELGIDKAHFVGCSQGGAIAIDFTLQYPQRVLSLILVASAVAGFEYKEESPHVFSRITDAWQAGDLETVNHLEIDYWVKGYGRDDVNPDVRQLAFEMNAIALGFPEPRAQIPMPHAIERLGEIDSPCLLIIGANDVPETHATMGFLHDKISSAQLVTMNDAAHLPNMEHPAEFNDILSLFLTQL